MQTEPNAKQQIVERIKSTTNILVTVGANPTVDELSAALALSLMLNRMDKHATAVFSGAIPPAISFLEPEKTFEPTVDSLRDFIIALDKEKADRLRYKVEDDVVRVFITPYKTVITEKDLQFSQGDFNVELIVALGVEKREDLDIAITAHGRILHDATVVTVNANPAQTSNLGAIDWSDAGSSSLCEMLMSLSESLQSGLLDQQIATALLTGIVAATDRFRNEHTSPRVMTMSAQLMAAGANQQLIATKLEQGYESSGPNVHPDGSVQMTEGSSEKLDRSVDDGTMEISHQPLPADEPLSALELPTSEPIVDMDDQLGEALAQQAPAMPTLSVEELQSDLANAADEMNTAADQLPVDDPDHPMIKKEHRNWRTDDTANAPAFGGTLNATAADAEDAKRKEQEDRDNQQTLSHDMPSDQPTFADTAGMPVAPFDEPAQDPSIDDPLPQTVADTDLQYEEAPIPAPTRNSPTLAEIDEQTRGKATDDARAAVEAALGAMPFDPAGQPLQSAGASAAVDVQHQPVQVSPAYAPPASPVAASLDLMPQLDPASAPSLPPLPDFSTLPPLPGELPDVPSSVQTPPSVDVPPVVPADPAQFRIPGQP